MSYVLIAVLCLAAGVAIGWYAARSRAAAEVATLTARLQSHTEGEARLEQSLRALSHDVQREAKGELSELVQPLWESLDRYQRHIADVERARLDAYATLRTQVAEVARTSDKLRGETASLSSALRAPQVRGRWGEHQLRRVVEAAGMLEHCDFTEQLTTAVEDRVIRPDLVVHLAGGRSVVVDAKAPFEAYLEAMEATDEPTRDTALSVHAKQLRAHVDALARKEYWRAFDTTPEFVVLYVPADAFLDAALRREPALLEYAFSRDIVLATPATLVAMLRTIAYSWRQDTLARNAAEVHTLAKELYGRLSTMGAHLTRLGASLSASVQAYNKAVGSIETRVLVTARKFAEMGVSKDELAVIDPVELTPRQVRAGELGGDS
ncbi:hypothetical protein Afil01_11460 [Actinorhabdospora filicis]|uniref:DNA recombination protein RmuC n=1 Tax=Actinorhabdospora filicis TaxID=1785913 RepID=A0A9W6W798_9ACTN|nr:DNA recombination protein RmuC [Actinorhabdospora filicis]GLZ76339.1 hypothetical protein Afil01_11460 [Actinorhabdospora filicis]